MWSQLWGSLFQVFSIHRNQSSTPSPNSPRAGPRRNQRLWGELLPVTWQLVAEANTVRYSCSVLPLGRGLARTLEVTPAVASLSDHDWPSFGLMPSTDFASHTGTSASQAVTSRVTR